jgi:hypothetical protein
MPDTSDSAPFPAMLHGTPGCAQIPNRRVQLPDAASTTVTRFPNSCKIVGILAQKTLKS